MKALAINYEYCTGCHSCEVACKNYLELSKDEFGIKISEVGPFEMLEGEGCGKNRWEWYFIPSVTKLCNLCEDRTAKGKMPMCVQHCQAWCMYYGEADELLADMGDGTRWALITAKA